jgi:hypothetical protein
VVQTVITSSRPSALIKHFRFRMSNLPQQQKVSLLYSTANRIPYQGMSGSRLAWSLALGLCVILFTCPHCQGLMSSSIESPEPELPLRDGSNEVSLAEHQKRHDYSCGPGKPCSNGACCGSSGFCGYGPVYCGKGCVSNCDATAECGKYAKTPRKTCPLNTW